MCWRVYPKGSVAIIALSRITFSETINYKKFHFLNTSREIIHIAAFGVLE